MSSGSHGLAWERVGMKVSLVVPAYNEGGVIGHSVRRIDSELGDLGVPYEIVVGDDGSTDGTAEEVRELGLETVRIVRRPHRGKGAILTAAIPETRGGIVGFIDADLEIDIRYLDEFVSALEAGYDVAIASKNLDPEYARDRKPSRRLTTAGYNFLVRRLFGTGISDHQAGFKLFRREIVEPVLREVKATGWLWDTEVLLGILERGGRIREIPVRTEDHREGHVNVVSTSWNMFRDIWKLYLSDGRRRPRAGG